jgi:hypothetical protein
MQRLNDIGFKKTFQKNGVEMTFKIDTLKKGAVILFSDGSRIAGHFFVSSVSPRHTGSQAISELLAEDRAFVPFELETGDVTLVNKATIAMVKLQTDELNKDVPGYKQIKASLDLLSGETKDCSVCFALPESHSRLSDFFNSCRDFIHIEAAGEYYLVQAKAIKRILTKKH